MGGNSSKNSTSRKDKSNFDIPTPIKLQIKPWSLQENKIPLSGFYHNEPVYYSVNGRKYRSKWVSYMGQKTYQKSIGHVDDKNSTTCPFRDYCIKFLKRIGINNPDSLLTKVSSDEGQKYFSKWCIMNYKREKLSWDRVVNILYWFFTRGISVEQIYIEDYFKDGEKYTLKIYREVQQPFHSSYEWGGN